MQNDALYQELASQLSALSAEQAEAVRDYLRELSASGGDEAEKNNKYLTFLCCEQMFGIDIRQVIQIIRIPSITPLPDSLPYMKGVVAMRGEMVPVIDLRIRLGRDAAIDSSRNCIIVISARERSVGIIVDSISSVEAIQPEEICQPPRQEDHKTNYLIGIVKRDAVILLIDADNLFTAQDFDDVLDIPTVQAAQPSEA